MARYKAVLIKKRDHQERRYSRKKMTAGRKNPKRRFPSGPERVSSSCTKIPARRNRKAKPRSKVSQMRRSCTATSFCDADFSGGVDMRLVVRVFLARKITPEKDVGKEF